MATQRLVTTIFAACDEKGNFQELISLDKKQIKSVTKKRGSDGTFIVLYTQKGIVKSRSFISKVTVELSIKHL